MRLFPFQDLRGYQPKDFRADAIAAFSVLFMAVPQGVAYAIIAGLPPVMGLYAAAIPTIVGALLRSSRHVITGPTNALSLLYGAGIAQQMDTDPALTAITAALLVGILQITAALLRAGSMLTYISRPLLLGYITGAGVLIGLGQLSNFTGTESVSGSVIESLIAWSIKLPTTSIMALSISISTVILILLIQRLKPNLPGPAIAMTVATVACIGLNLQDTGLVLVKDLSPMTTGLPSLTLPDLSLVMGLLPISIALTILSLIESNSIAQTIGLDSQQIIDNDVEFLGQGFANLSAAFCAGYPISGSLSRSKLNHTAGAQSRLAGVISGLLMLLVLLGLSDFINYTPLCALAGLLMLVAWNLIDRQRIRTVLRASLSDKLMFLFTVIAMLTLNLDVAIYASIGLAIIISRFNYEPPSIHEHRLEKNSLQSSLFPSRGHIENSKMRVMELRGKVQFAFALKIQDALHQMGQDKRTKRVVIHFNTSQDIDYTVATTLAQSAHALQKQGIEVMIAGLSSVSREQLDNVAQFNPKLIIDYLSETGNWDAEKHQNASLLHK